MGRQSDDSDSDAEYRKRVKKKKSRRSSRSKSRDRRSRSRTRRSRSRSRDRRTRSRERKSRDRRSRSRDRRSKEHYSRRSKSRSRNRKSRNRSRSKTSSSRSRTHVSNPPTPPPPIISSVEPEVMMTIADELKRARAIADIESDSFVQRDFQTNYNKVGEIEEAGKFDFGTSAERKSKTEAEEAMEKLNREGLFNPMLFGDQEKREKRFLQHVWTIRQRAVKALQQQN